MIYKLYIYEIVIVPDKYIMIVMHDFTYILHFRCVYTLLNSLSHSTLAENYYYYC